MKKCPVCNAKLLQYSYGIGYRRDEYVCGMQTIKAIDGSDFAVEKSCNLKEVKNEKV